MPKKAAAVAAEVKPSARNVAVAKVVGETLDALFPGEPPNRVYQKISTEYSAALLTRMQSLPLRPADSPQSYRQLHPPDRGDTERTDHGREGERGHYAAVSASSNAGKACGDEI